MDLNPNSNMEISVLQRKFRERMNFPVNRYSTLFVVQRVLRVVNLSSPALNIDPAGQFEALLMGQFGALMMQTKRSTILLDGVKSLISMIFKGGTQRISLPTKAMSKLSKERALYLATVLCVTRVSTFLRTGFSSTAIHFLFLF